MQYYINTINNKLKKAVINIDLYDNKNFNRKTQELIDKKIFIIKNFSFFVVHNILIKFLFFFSKNLINLKKKKKNLVFFIKIFNYLNVYFFKNKIHFFKKFFIKKNLDLFYLNKYFFSIKLLNEKKFLFYPKEKKLAFYKKNIWVKKRKFRKKNILIFNKIFFKKYNSDRFNSFIIDSLCSFLKLAKQRYFRNVKKRLFNIFYRKYYYLFLFKCYTFNKRKKKYKNFFSYDLDSYQTETKILYKKKFFVKKRWKRWRKIYSIKRRNIFSRMLFYSFNMSVFNKTYAFFLRKNPFEDKEILKNYLDKYGLFLSKKFSKDKNFWKKFTSRKKIKKRHKNIIYFFKWKPKIFDFYSFNAFKKAKNFKNLSFSLIWYILFIRKIIWRNKKSKKKFIIFFSKNFLYNKNLLFSNFLNINKHFLYATFKRKKRVFKLKRRRLTFYNNRKRKKILKKRIKVKILRFFIVLLFLNFLKKNKNLEKNLKLNYSFFYKNFKKVNLFFIYSALIGLKPIYFYNNNLFHSSFFLNFPRKTLKIISLLSKK